MTEGENLQYLQSQLEVYLSLLDITPATQRIHRKAISGFFPLLFARGRKIPCEDDYDDYRCYLHFQKKKSLSFTDYAVSCVQRFFTWSAENPKCTSIETLNTPPKQRPRTKRTRRVSTLLSPYLYESLEILANYDCTDIPTMLNTVVSKYVAQRKNDIDRVKDYELVKKGMAIAGVQIETLR